MKVAFKAIDSRGGIVSDILEAGTVLEAVEKLRSDGLFVTDVQESSGRIKKVRGGETTLPSDEGHFTLGELMYFTRQMSMLLRSGSPVVPSLIAVGKQLKGRARAVVEQLRKDMEGGKGLAESMKRYPRTFSDVYGAIVGAGEMSANMPDMFTRLAMLITRKREIRNRVMGAMAYPALLIMLSSSIITTMITFVIPRFSELFKSLNVTLPTTTQVLFGIATFVRGHGLWIGAGLAVVVATGVMFVRSDAGRQFFSNIQTRIPVVGNLFSRILQAQMFRVMGLLLESRVGILDALSLTKKITRNEDFRALFASMQTQLEQGNRLSDAMAQSKLIAPSLTQAVSTGEESGHLDQALLFVADVLEEENAQMIQTVTKLIEPLILILMGMIVGGIALSLFVPLFDLAAAAK